MYPKFDYTAVNAVLLLAFLSPGWAKPNIVLFHTDDQGTLDVNCYGSGDLHAPHLDKLAETGVLFTQAYAHTVCCPSRAALLTGRHPNRGGVTNGLQGDRNGRDSHLENMNPSEIAIAEVLKKRVTIPPCLASGTSEPKPATSPASLIITATVTATTT